jgi:SRSO17 transposase
LSQELETFILDYQDILKSKTYRYTAKAHQYLCGLFQAEKRNIEKICEKVVDSERQNLNHFISESPCEWEPVIGRIGKDTSRLFAGRAEKIGLLIDESGWKKAGK